MENVSVLALIGQYGDAKPATKEHLLYGHQNSCLSKMWNQSKMQKGRLRNGNMPALRLGRLLCLRESFKS